jgi:serine protein kinase
VEAERPNEEMIGTTEEIIAERGYDRKAFPSGLIATIGAHQLDHPGADLDLGKLFPDLFHRLRDHYFEERKQTLRKLAQQVLRYLDERSQLLANEVQQVEQCLAALREQYGDSQQLPRQLGNTRWNSSARPLTPSLE